jgi:hypothetical protein
MDRIPTAQRTALYRIARNQTPEYGAIIEPMATASALLRRGLAIKAGRRNFARSTGICLRLTEAGQAYIDSIEGKTTT